MPDDEYIPPITQSVGCAVILLGIFVVMACVDVMCEVWRYLKWLTR